MRSVLGSWPWLVLAAGHAAGQTPAPAQVLAFLQASPGATACATAAPAVTAQGFDYVSCFMPRTDVEVWSVAKPNVQQAETTYPAVAFRKGDLVSFAAGGCANRGGAGQTNFRYVDPNDLNSEHIDMWHGSASIPGVLAPTPLRDLLAHDPIEISSTPGPDAQLHLHYKDNNYGDNGYGHDWGLWEQCKDMESAWVVVVIQRNCAGDASTRCSRAAPLDLVAQGTDANGYPKNPKWGWQTTTGARPSPGRLCNFSRKSTGMRFEDDAHLCTRQPTQKNTNWWACPQSEPGNPSGTLGRIRGHLNWSATGVATYQGVLRWQSYSGEDHDYNFDLALRNNKGEPIDNGIELKSDAASGPEFAMEFDSDETVDLIDRDRLTWWNTLHTAVDDGWASNLVGDSTFAIVTGLVGLDCAHSCRPELHPVYAMAVHIKDDPNDDVWAILLRNWGNEGYCGPKDERVPGMRSYSFTLPKRYATGVAVGPGTDLRSVKGLAGGPTVQLLPSRGARVTFTLPDPGEHELVTGDLHLQWTTQHWAAQVVYPLRPVDIMQRVGHTPEALIERLVDRMTTEERRRYDELVPKRERTKRVETLLQATLGAELPEAEEDEENTAPPRPVRVEAAPNPEYEEYLRKRRIALCRAYGGRIREVPDLCDWR